MEYLGVSRGETHLCTHAHICVNTHILMCTYIYVHVSISWLRHLGRARIQDQLLACVYKAGYCRDPQGVHVCVHDSVYKAVHTCCWHLGCGPQGSHAQVPTTGKTGIHGQLPGRLSPAAGGRHTVHMQMHSQEWSSILLRQRREQDGAGFRSSNTRVSMQKSNYGNLQTTCRLRIGLQDARYFTSLVCSSFTTSKFWIRIWFASLGDCSQTMLFPGFS